MHKFDLFDSVQLNTIILGENLSEGRPILSGTLGVIVEILDDDAYLVEFFGDNWLKYSFEESTLVPAKPFDSDAFQETLDVSFVTSSQLALLQSASETMARKT
ncbi:MAG: DUF4926 domain-containing protein [Chloroflexota bacterium]